MTRNELMQLVTPSPAVMEAVEKEVVCLVLNKPLRLMALHACKKWLSGVDDAGRPSDVLLAFIEALEHPEDYGTEDK